jgi:hypothetical protein
MAVAAGILLSLGRRLGWGCHWGGDWAGFEVGVGVEVALERGGLGVFGGLGGDSYFVVKSNIFDIKC